MERRAGGGAQYEGKMMSAKSASLDLISKQAWHAFEVLTSFAA